MPQTISKASEDNSAERKSAMAGLNLNGNGQVLAHKFPLSKSFIRLWFLIGDFSAAAIGWLSFVGLRTHILEDFQPGVFFDAIGPTVFISTCWVILYAFCGFYNNELRKSRSRELLTLLYINILGLGLLILGIVIDASYISQEGLEAYLQAYRNLLQYFVLHFSITAGLKVVVMTWSKHLMRQGKAGFNTILIGSAGNALEIFSEINSNNKHLGLHFSGFVYTDSDLVSPTLSGSLPKLGHIDQLERIVEEQKIEQAILALETKEHRVIEKILTCLDGYNLHISVLPDMYQILLGSVKVSHVFGTPLIEIKCDLMPVWQKVTKRAMDIGVSISVMIIGFPFLFTIAMLTKFSSKGPIFYRQERIGLGGVPFKIIKFRSMYTDAEARGPQLASNNDPRVTPWGRFMRKTRLDELPQFWNVLVGEMSLVGPRPERQHFIDQIVKVAPHYRHLNRVRPGITSLGQVKFGYAENVEQMVRRLRWDIIYIENMSLFMDFRIMFYTVWTVLMGRGK